MSGIKLIAVDLDDTLLDSGLRVTPRVKQAVRRAAERNVTVALATGRMFCAALPYAEELALTAPLITYQGALVKDRAGVEYYYQPVPRELAQDVITHLLPAGYHLQVYVDDTLCMARLTPEGERYARLSGVAPRVVGDLRLFLTFPPTKIVLIAPEKAIDELLPDLTARYTGLLHVSKSKPHFLEFSHPDATKGEALRRLAAELGVDREEVMAIGDGYNDIPMLEFAGLAVVVENARAEIKAYAAHVTAGNDSDGVALAIEELVLKGDEL
jgi:Cof subfamily protein (haloacid dehalogenase superfamily)